MSEDEINKAFENASASVRMKVSLLLMNQKNYANNSYMVK